MVQKDNMSWKEGLFSELQLTRGQQLRKSSINEAAIAIYKVIDDKEEKIWENLNLHYLILTEKDTFTVPILKTSSYYIILVDTRVRSMKLTCDFTTQDAISGSVEISVMYQAENIQLLTNLADPLGIIRQELVEKTQNAASIIDFPSMTQVQLEGSLLASNLISDTGIKIHSLHCEIRWSEKLHVDYDKRESIKEALDLLGINSSIPVTKDVDTQALIEALSNYKMSEVMDWLLSTGIPQREIMDNYLKNMREQLSGGDLRREDIESLIETWQSSHPQEISFTAFSPSEVNPKRKYGIYVYAYLNELVNDIKLDVTKFIEELGGSIPKPRHAKESAKLQIETPITIIPECNDLEFEPASLTKKWHGDWTRFEFEFRPTNDLVSEMLFVRISIQVAGIEIAHIKSAIEVIEAGPVAETQETLVSNPLLESKMKSQTVTPYQRIFISYSRRDSSVARAYKMAQMALGNDAFLDVDNLRSGEDWRAALARAIDKADIFQLFWSENSASSEYCRYEWDYAMKVRCPEDNCEGFIRPVYWHKPMPSPPPELSRINFRFVPFEDQDD